MRYTATALFALASATLSAAQAADEQYDSALDMTISDPLSVDESLRWDWCTAQENSCITLCDDDPAENRCGRGDLTYECTCASNDSAPGLQYYRQTMPSFICEELLARCRVENDRSQDGQEDCVTNIGDLCPTQNVPSSVSDDDEDDDDDSEETSSDTASQTAPDSTASGDAASSTDMDDFAAPTMVPLGSGLGAAAVAGLVVYLV